MIVFIEKKNLFLLEIEDYINKKEVRLFRGYCLYSIEYQKASTGLERRSRSPV